MMNATEHKRYTARSLWYFAICALCMYCGAPAYAQRYPFHNLNVEDGLVQSQVTCLAQDRTGNLWIGTLGGLSRYDGREFTNYTVRNGLLSNAVTAIAPDSAGNIWIGGQSGLSYYNGKEFRHFRRQQGAGRRLDNTQQIQITGDTTWWRVQGDVYYLVQGKIHPLLLPGGPGYVSSILAGNDGEMWLAKDRVLYHKMDERWDTIRFAIPPEQVPPAIYRIYKDHGGTVWLGTGMGLFKVAGGAMVPHIVDGYPLLSAAVISSITQDQSGALLLGTTSGVLKTGPKGVEYYNKHNGLSDNYFYDMLTDAEGNVWMGSDGQGIFRFSGTQFTRLDESVGLPSAQVMGIASNNRDSLFLGTYDAGIFIFKDGKVSPFSFPSTPVPAITSLCYTRKAKLWIGTRGRGLWSYSKGIFRQYAAPERNFPSDHINSLYEDPSGRLWIGFANGAIVIANDSFKTALTKSAPVYSFLQIGADSVLIATEGTLMLYTAGESMPYITGTKIDSSQVQCFTRKGTELWMGCNDNGVIRYNMRTGKAQVINKASGMRSDFIYNIVADNEGNIWAGTGYGIHKIQVTAAGQAKVTFYGKAQGITGMESNINSVLKLTDGSIWFGTTNGALHYLPNTAVIQSAPTGIVLQSVKLAGESTIDHAYFDSADHWHGIPYNLRLPYKRNNISFTFQAVSLAGVQQITYRYRMDGLETIWSDWSATNSVTYSALPPGSYVFHVECRSADGQANPALAYEFEIITPFQKTAWFRFAVLAACLLAGILLQYMVTSRKQRRQRLLNKLRSEEQSKIRLRTAEDFHDEIGNKLTRINVLTNVLKSKIAATPDTTRILGQIEDNTAQLYSGTRDILWSLKPSNDNLYEILERINDCGVELYQDTAVNFTFNGTDEKWRKFRLPMDMSRNLIMIFKEAMNNSLKYAQAKNVSIDVIIKNRNVLQLTMRDDGQGFDQQTIKRGNGLNNMNVRAGRLNGRLYIDTRAGKGTIINLTFRMPKMG